jgi:parallel beta-helix repeat protein
MNVALRGLAALSLLWTTTVGCGDEDETTPAGADAGTAIAPEGCDVFLQPSDADNDQERVQEAFILLEAGQTLCFDEGTFSFVSELTMDTDDVLIRGAGRTTTLLDFTNQDSGGNGIKITGDRVTVEDLRVVDPPGDGIRADDVEDITFRRIDVMWPNDQSRDNGAYGLYPVGCEGVLIDDVLVVGARDAGIYVGQSNNILVKDSEAYGNVAGIEIENSNDAEVRNCHAHNNTAGILVFNLPGLAQYGSRTKVVGNLIEDNNLPNFGVEGTVVAAVPGGTGMLFLAVDGNEVHDNIIRNNNSFGVLFFTYLPGLFGSYDDDNFDPYCEDNYIHSNTFENNGTDPFGTLHGVAGQFIPVPTPEIVVDGCIAEGTTAVDLCQENNGEVGYLSLDFCNSFAAVSQDLAAISCTGNTLPTIER